MSNHQYSIYIAQDNASEVVDGFLTLYFDIAKVTSVSGHYFSLQQQIKGKEPRPSLGSSSVLLTYQQVEDILKKTVQLKNGLLKESEELSINLGRGAEIIFIYSVS